MLCQSLCIERKYIFFVPYLGPLFVPYFRAHQKRIALIVWLKSTFLVVEKCGKNNISTKWKKELTFRPSEIFQHCFLIDFFSCMLSRKVSTLFSYNGKIPGNFAIFNDSIWRGPNDFGFLSTSAKLVLRKVIDKSSCSANTFRFPSSMGNSELLFFFSAMKFLAQRERKHGLKINKPIDK